ncbi:MAG: transcriptional regulator protein, partial [Acidobacteria bacterium]|nr:transcriptional regulator protein [Acidobacteriota bacterium]
TAAAPAAVRLERKRPRLWLWAAAALLVMLAGSFGTYRLLVKKPESAVPFQAMTAPRRLTTHGKVGVATISPDANYVAYSVLDAGRESILVRQIATAVDRTIIARAEAGFEALNFSQDGNYIYYLKREKDREIRTLHRMSVLGGNATKLIEDVDSPVTFSPDGKRLAFVRYAQHKQESSLVVAGADGSDQKGIVTRKYSEVTFYPNPAWSPDGTVIVVGIEDSTRRGQLSIGLAEVQVEGGAIREISTQRWMDMDQIAWLGDGRGFLMSAGDQSTGWSYQIWFVSYPGGKAHKVTNDPNNYAGTSLSRDSGVLLTVNSDRLSSISVAPDGDTSRLVQITTGKYDGFGGVAWARGGKIVYGTRDWDIWIMEEDGSNPRLLTPDEHNNRHPAVSPDGRTIFFESWRNGDDNIWQIGADGSGSSQFTRGVWDERPVCSPDGKWVFYVSWISDKAEILKVEPAGGEPVRVGSKLWDNPAISPDGKRIAGLFYDTSTFQTSLNVASFDGREPEKSFALPPWDSRWARIRWTPDGQALTYPLTSGSVSNIWIQPLAGGPARQLTNFTTDLIRDFDWTPDNRLILARGPENQDLVLISNRENR